MYTIFQRCKGYHRGHLESEDYKPANRTEGLEPEAEGHAELSGEGCHGRYAYEPRNYIPPSG